MGEEKASVRNNKKTHADVKKIAKKLWKKGKFKKNKHGDKEILIDNSGVDNLPSGSSIEVDPSTDVERCCCNERDGNQKYCHTCGRKLTGKHRRRVQNADKFGSSSSNLNCDMGSGGIPPKKKKYKKLKKARKLTWRAAKGTWKFVKAGFGMIANTPGLPTGPVQVTNIINNFHTGVHFGSASSTGAYR